MEPKYDNKAVELAFKLLKEPHPGVQTIVKKLAEADDVARTTEGIGELLGFTGATRGDKVFVELQIGVKNDILIKHPCEAGVRKATTYQLKNHGAAVELFNYMASA